MLRFFACTARIAKTPSGTDSKRESEEIRDGVFSRARRGGLGLAFQIYRVYGIMLSVNTGVVP